MTERPEWPIVELPPEAVAVEIEGAQRGEDLVLRCTFTDPLGDSRQLDLSPDVGADLLVKMAAMLRAGLQADVKDGRRG